MSGHEDLIAFGFWALAIGVPFVFRYLWEMRAIRKENERHHKALETAIKRLGGCAYGRGR